MTDEPIPAEPVQDLPIYTAPLAEPPPNVLSVPARGEQGGDSG